jgi:hypothetical protein
MSIQSAHRPYAPATLYSPETCFLFLIVTSDITGGNKLRVFENRVLRTIFGLGRDEVTGEWRKLHNEELHDLYPSSSIIRMM